MNTLIKIRNAIIRFKYRYILKPIFFRFDPEDIHDQMIRAGKFLGKFRFTRFLTKTFFYYSNSKLEQTICEIKFDNPIGLAAGFDKNAELTDILPEVGFGFAEVGSVTGEPCEGNAKPRLWRLKKSNSLLVNYGLKNNGCEEISKRLENKTLKIPVGISIAKTNCEGTVDTDAGIADYLKAYKAFCKLDAYITINISCPNAFGGQPFTSAEKLERLLTAIDKERDLTLPSPLLSRGDAAIDGVTPPYPPLESGGDAATPPPFKEVLTGRSRKPILLKLSPDLSTAEIDEIIEVSRRHKINGFICTNLTKNRANERIVDSEVPAVGGISGKVTQELSDNLIKYVYQKTRGEFVIVGCGGVFTAVDAYRKIKLGASLIQMITGMIYEGPQVVSEINRGLVELLERDGYSNIGDAVGCSASSRGSVTTVAIPSSPETNLL